MDIIGILKILFPALMVIGALGSLVVNIIAKGDWPTSLQWIGASLLYTALLFRNKQEVPMEKNIQLHKELIDYLHNLYITKNNDYGNSVHDTYEKYGLTSFLVRLEDKLNRARSLHLKKEQLVNDEKLEDTLLDLANYAILAVIELKNERE